MQLFIPFYILIVLSILLTQCKLHKLSNSSVNLLIISILLIFFISVGSRPFDFQGDTGTYLWMFQSISNAGKIHEHARIYRLRSVAGSQILNFMS